MEWNLAQLLLFVFIYLPAAITIIAFIFGISTPRYEDDAATILVIALITLFLGAFLTGMPYIIVNITSKSEIAQMEAFYDQNVEAYRDTIMETENITIINATPGVFFDAAYQGLGVTVGTAIADFRNEITSYNNQIAKYEAWQDTFVGSGYMQSLPDHLKPLRLQLSEN